MPDYQKEYVRDQILELAKWSKDEHERRFCVPGVFWYRHYKNWVDKRLDAEDYRSNIGVGLAFPIIEIMYARLMEPWLGGDFMVQARAYDEAGEQAAPIAAAHVNDILQRGITRGMTNVGLVKKSALILGRGIGKYWVRKDRPRMVPQRKPIEFNLPMLGKMSFGSTVSLQRIDPPPQFEFRYIDPFNFWLEPGKRFSVEDGESFTFEQSYASTAEIWAQIEAGNWDEPEGGVDEEGVGYDDFTYRRINWQGGAEQEINRTGSPNPHRILEFQGRCETKESRGSRPKYEDVRCVVVNNDWVADLSPLDTWNGKPGYIVWEPVTEPISERPIGMIEPIEDILLTLNDFVNIALDNGRKIIESPLLIDPSAMPVGERLVLGPAAQNFVRNPTISVRPLEMKDLPGSFFELLGWFNDLVQRISGVSDFFGGLNTSDTDRLTKTATGMSLMASLSASRFGPNLASVDREFYRPLCEAIHNTSRLFVTDAVNVRLPGSPRSPYTKMTPEMLGIPFEFSYSLRGLDPSSAQRRDEFVQMIDTLVGLSDGLAQQGLRVDFYEIARVLTDEFNRGQEIQRIVKAMDPMQMEAMGQQAAMGQAQAQVAPQIQMQPGTPVPGQPVLPTPSAAAPAASSGTSMTQLMEGGE